MYSSYQLALKYLSYYFTAANGSGHGTHSPFVFAFIKNVLIDRKEYPEYRLVENLRKELRLDERELDVLDLGAGSAHTKTSKRKISDIVRNAAKPAKFAQLLFRLAKYYKPANILELGTSLGISTAYLALANPATSVTSIEGSPAVSREAEKNVTKLSLENVAIKTGPFDEILPLVLPVLSGPLLVFIDGNHSRRPTLNYFHTLLPTLEEGSILIFDDIHWSEEMEEAWDEIRQHSDVMLTIDLFFIGIVFFRKEFKIRQHFTIRF